MAKTKRTSGPIPSKTLRQRAEEMSRASPTDIAGMTSNEVQRLIHELEIHQIELELQNEELRQAQVELAHSRDQYSDLYEFADDGTGFNLSEKSEGMGLKTMQYRASLIGANLAITPVESGGTLVTCKVFGGRGELR